MKKSTKLWLAAGSLILLGSIVFIFCMFALEWDFSRLSTVEYQTNITEIDETFNDISISTDTSNIVFALSDDGKCKVECYEDKKAKHSVNVENNALIIEIDNQKSWYDYIGLRLCSQKITIYLPKTEYNALSVRGNTGNVTISDIYTFNSANISLSTGTVDFRASASGLIKIKTTTGNISVKSNLVGALDLSVTTGTVTVLGSMCKGDIEVNVSTGKTHLTDVECNSLKSDGTTGNITLSNLLVRNKLSVGRSTGDIKLERCDAGEMYIKTTTGDVSGSLLSGKQFITSSETGKVHVPTTGTGGKCEIITRSGNIKIEIC